MADLKPFFNFEIKENTEEPTGFFIGPNQLIYVCNCDSKGSVQVFDLKSKFQFEFDLKGDWYKRLHCPYQITFGSTDQLLYIHGVNDSNFEIQVFDLEGNFKFFLCEESFKNRLTQPKMRLIQSQIGPNRLIYINVRNHIRAFDHNGKLQFIFGLRNSDGDLLYENDYRGLYFGSNDLLYVCDFHNHCIQVFDQKGNFKFQFGSEGKKPGQFHHPYNLWISPDQLLYICDISWFIHVFNMKGEFQFRINLEIFKKELGFDIGSALYSLQIGPNNLLYILDEDNECFRIFQHTKDKSLYQIIAESLKKRKIK